MPVQNFIANLNGNDASSIAELLDLQIEATFDQGNPSGNITSTELTFVNEYAAIIRDYLAGGLDGTTPGYSEGIPFTLDLQQDNLPVTRVFDGCLDFGDESFRRVDPTTYKSKLLQTDGLETLQENSRGLTFRSLYDQGVITDSDFISIPYVVEREFNFVEFALLGITTYVTARELVDSVQRIAKDIQDVVDISVGGFPGTGQAAGIISAAVRLLINAIFTAALLVNMIKLVREVIAYLISPVKFHKGIRVKTLLEKASAYLGYTYNTSIDEIANNSLAILPSKNNIDIDKQALDVLLGIQVNQPGLGIPSSEDVGYTFAELLQAMNTTFRAKLSIKDNVIQHHALNSTWWLTNSSYTMPTKLDESIRVNMPESYNNHLIRFKTDQRDENTVIDFSGTTHEVIVNAPTFNDRKCNMIKGAVNVDVPYALGSRKEGLNRLETLVKELAALIDTVINLFGGNGNNESKVTARIGMLKIGTDFVNVPKLMVLDNSNKLPANNRSVWSAQVLWDKYHVWDSFVGSDPTNFKDANQWYIFEQENVRFSYLDYLKVVDNSYFYDCDGRVAQITKLNWSPARDTATISYRVRQLWSKNFKETKIVA